MVEEVSKDKIKKVIEMAKDRRLLQEFKDIRKEIENLPESEDKDDILMSFDALVKIIYNEAIIIEYLFQNNSP